MREPAGSSRSLGARLRRLFSTPEEIEAEELEERARDSGASRISDAVPRQRVKVRGTISALDEVDDAGWLQATLTDGSGEVRLVWMGRRSLQCIAPGTRLVVTGRLAGDEDTRVIYNPEFEVVSPS